MATPEVTSKLVELGAAGLYANFGQAYARYNARSSPTRASRIVVEAVRGQDGWGFEDEYLHGIVLAGANGLYKSTVTDEVSTLVRLILEAAVPSVIYAQETDEQLFEATLDTLQNEPAPVDEDGPFDDEQLSGDAMDMDEEAFEKTVQHEQPLVKMGAKQFAVYINKSETYVKEHAQELGGVKVGRVWQFEVTV